MPWWNPRRKEPPRPDDVGQETSSPPDEARAASQSRIQPVIRDAERRRLSRLLQRSSNLQYDIDEAETAFLPENRWTERTEQLNDAIKQAETDLSALKPEQRATQPDLLPHTPLEVVAVSPQDPASVTLRVAGQTLLYREEPDWAERGHQLALPQLTRAEGDVDSFIPEHLADPERTELIEHLRHSFAIVAAEALEQVADGLPLQRRTLADLAQPCPRCGGWLDPKGRCPRCAQLDWQRQEIRAALNRLINERDDVLEDLALTRDRLPVLRRQLAETENDIAQLRAKGVDVK